MEIVEWGVKPSDPDEFPLCTEIEWHGGGEIASRTLQITSQELGRLSSFNPLYCSLNIAIEEDILPT